MHQLQVSATCTKVWAGGAVEAIVQHVNPKVRDDETCIITCWSQDGCSWIYNLLNNVVDA